MSGTIRVRAPVYQLIDSVKSIDSIYRRKEGLVRRFTPFLAYLSMLLLAGCAAAPPPTPAPGTEPLVLRRQTLIVRDIDRALALYRDAIGMTVIYDQLIRRTHPTENRPQVNRLVFLKATNDYIGVLGLLEYEHGDKSHPIHNKPVVKEGFTPGHAVVLFNTNDLAAKWPAIRAAPGVEVMSEPALREFPAYNGQGTIRVMVTTFYDADGFLVEFNQPLDAVKTR
jgi:catechol 2,3-dioxygenase-like lactoylglutathione lyase family enzyme